jgi:hypothetical protein
MKFLIACASLVLTMTFSNLSKADDFDPAQAEGGAFDVNYTTCTSEGHQASVHFRLSNYSPVDTPPTGYAQATKEEVQAIAQIVFPDNFSKPFQLDTDARVLEDGYLSDLAMQDVEMIDEGKTVTTSRAIKAMNEVKFILMKDLKYSGMGINYLESSVKVDAHVLCESQL